MTESRNPGARTQPAHYPALDGLRAVAALMVFCQHYAASKLYIFGWGWTGVDFFFVLSGFLITGILYDSRDRVHRYRDFYVRRTLRIFPLYYAVWLGILLVSPIAQWRWSPGWFLWPAYLGNYTRFLFTDHPGGPMRFDRLTFGPLVQGWFNAPMHLYIQHFWSLCLEEQFYLLWPCVVYQVRRRETLIKICIAVIVAMPVIRWVVANLASPQALQLELLYRSLPTRLDALLIGGLVALMLRGPQKAWLRRARPFLIPAAAILLGATYGIAVHLTQEAVQGTATDWRVYGFTLIDLFAAALVVDCIHPGGLVSGALALAPLRALGRISYGFYVYHELFHDFYAWAGARLFPQNAFAATTTLAFVCTIAIAWLSFRFLETPFLRLKEQFASQTHSAPVA
ncbi:MAG: acyltransferase [Acetobacteraceae bacterium]|nr:acyltransferase [Acetobacteraceae bacterium]